MARPSSRNGPPARRSRSRGGCDARRPRAARACRARTTRWRRRAPKVAERDAPLLAALVFGALRWHHRLEWQCARLLTRPFKAGQLELAALLRDRAAAAAAPANSRARGRVRDGRRGRRDRSARRRAARERSAPAFSARARGARNAALEDVPEARFSHPRLAPRVACARLARRIGSESRREQRASADVVARQLAQNDAREEYLARLAGGRASRASASADVEAAVMLDAPQRVEALPGFAEGRGVRAGRRRAARRGFSISKPGQRVLDACAAPGGKTGHILEACPRLAEVWALDRDRGAPRKGPR